MSLKEGELKGSISRANPAPPVRSPKQGRLTGGIKPAGADRRNSQKAAGLPKEDRRQVGILFSAWRDAFERSLQNGLHPGVDPDLPVGVNQGRVEGSRLVRDLGYW